MSKIGGSLMKHPLIRDLVEMKGNQRACTWLEPLWGIPYNLYAPYATLFMYSLGLTDVKIGALLSLGMFLQIFSSILGGVVSDKLGRKVTTVIFDCLSWSVPCLLWAFAQNYMWFLIAAIFNSLWKITDNSWSSLLVEDTDPDKLVNTYTWITVSGRLSVFFAPLSAILVGVVGVVPAMRALYILTFVMMTAKFLILFFLCTETKQGKKKMEENKGVSLWKITKGYKGVFIQVLKNPVTLLTLAIMVILSINYTVIDTYFALYVAETMHVKETFLSYFPMIRAAIMLAFLFGLQYRFEKLPFKYPMLVGFVLYIISHILLIFANGSVLMIIGYTALEAFGYALIMPRKDSMMTLNVDPEERSRIISILQVIMIGATAPFGYLTGWLSSIDRSYTFILNIGLFVLGMIMVVVYDRVERKYRGKA